MHLNQIASLQPQRRRLEFRSNCDRQSADCQAVYLASAVYVCVFRHFKDSLLPKIGAFSVENENGRKHKNSHFWQTKPKRISVGLCSKQYAKIIFFSSAYFSVINWITLISYYFSYSFLTFSSSYSSFSLTEIDFPVILTFQFLLQLTEIVHNGAIQCDCNLN